MVVTATQKLFQDAEAPQCVGGITLKWTTATKGHDEQDHRTDLHLEVYHSNLLVNLSHV